MRHYGHFIIKGMIDREVEREVPKFRDYVRDAEAEQRRAGAAEATA